ncbi:MAG: hypothetical protein VCD00_08880 [Candidatus Hydrogenedentota bacterium]
MLSVGMGAAFAQAPRNSGTSGSVDNALRSKVKRLEKKLARVELRNQVLWELVRDSLKLTDADLKARMKEIDLRDGVEDGAITTVPLRCPQCQRVSSSQHWKCMYCGLDFEEGAY